MHRLQALIALDPITLSATAGPGRIDWSLYPETRRVKVANYSAFAVEIDIDGRRHWLDLLTADVYDVEGLGLNYRTVAAVSSAPAGGTLLVTLADRPGERIPGIYPLHLR